MPYTFLIVIMGLILQVKNPVSQQAVNAIKTENQLKAKAQQALTNRNYQAATSYLHQLVDSLHANDPALKLNLANAYYKQQNTEKATDYYNQIVQGNNKPIKSMALNQLGKMAADQQQKEQALHYFKQALINDPTNQTARYNYELLKKQNQDQDQQNQDKKDNQDQQNQKKQDKKDKKNQDQQNNKQQDSQDQQKEKNKQKDQQQNKDQQKQKDSNQDKKQEEKEKQQNQEGKKGDPKDKKPEDKKGEKKPEDKPEDKKENEAKQQQTNPAGQKSGKQQVNPDELKKINLSEQKAKQILDALRQNEIKYLQQKKQKPTQTPDRDTPNW